MHRLVARRWPACDQPHSQNTPCATPLNSSGSTETACTARSAVGPIEEPRSQAPTGFGGAWMSAPRMALTPAYGRRARSPQCDSLRASSWASCLRVEPVVSFTRAPSAFRSGSRRYSGHRCGRASWRSQSPRSPDQGMSVARPGCLRARTRRFFHSPSASPRRRWPRRGAWRRPGAGARGRRTYRRAHVIEGAGVGGERLHDLEAH